MKSYEYIGSPEHLAELNVWLAGRSHADVKPPWEDDD